MRNAALWGADTVLLVPAVVDAKTSYRDAYTRSQTRHPGAAAPAGKGAQGHHRGGGGLEQISPQPDRIRPLCRRVRLAAAARLFRRR